MNAEERLRRLMNPQCAEDYGLSVRLDELAECGEAGRKALNDLIDCIRLQAPLYHRVELADEEGQKT